MGDATETVNAKALKMSFQSKELEKLLDMIDQLRAQGISRFIDLPQMIVCGDQSSGKSSVLEAISGVRFPTKDNLCTRFPTELILRRSGEETISISIIPDAGCSEQERKQLEAFRAGPEAFDDFGAVVDAAGKAMGLDKGPKAFSNDVLRVELSGPKLPHLTIVDLPGLFHSGNKNQSKEDAEAVKGLVMKYISQPRSIILVVISAKNDYANQVVTTFAQEVDPLGERTLGIITKPDMLHAGSESEKQFFELAENKDVVLRLGWHVMKNRDFDTKDSSTEERDQAETEFFRKGIWTSLSPSQWGIRSLKPRLSKVLKNQILSELPGLIADVEAGISECEGRLERLGTSRATKLEQRTYLHNVSQHFGKLVESAVGGRYHDEFFRGDGNADGYGRRIRAVAWNLLDDFAEEMRKHGHQFQVAGHESDDGALVLKPEQMPIYVTITRRLQQVGDLIKQNRGLELPGFAKHETITMLFRDQCNPWSSIMKKYAHTIFEEVRLALYQALDEAADQTTSDGILRLIVSPALDELKQSLDAKVTQNLKQHLTGHPITFNHYFIENIQKLRFDHQVDFLESRLLKYFGRDEDEVDEHKEASFSVKELASALATNTEKDTFTFTCSEALHFMEAYYKVALKFVIDDFSIHTIEQGFLEQLPGIFDPATILGLDDQIIEDIAGETEESQAERASSSTKLAALRKALDALHRLDRGKIKSEK